MKERNVAGLVINVPYGALAIPPAVQKRLPLDQSDIRGEHWRLCDPFLLEIFKQASQGDAKRGPWPLVSFPWSPLVADPLGLIAVELGQARQDHRGPALLTKTTTDKAMPEWGESDRKFLMEKTVAPYAADLEAKCLAQLKDQHLVALITVRSFGSEPQTFERDRRRPRPQITLGASDDHTPDGLPILAGEIFRTLGFWPQLNWPVSGAVVPRELRGQPRLKALGLYLRRDLYLDERTGRLKENHEAVTRVLRTFFSLLCQELDRVAKIRIQRAFPPQQSSNIIKAHNPAVEV
jgi:hypothetical protein